MSESVRKVRENGYIVFCCGDPPNETIDWRSLHCALPRGAVVLIVNDGQTRLRLDGHGRTGFGRAILACEKKAIEEIAYFDRLSRE